MQEQANFMKICFRYIKNKGFILENTISTGKNFYQKLPVNFTLYRKMFVDDSNFLGTQLRIYY